MRTIGRFQIFCLALLAALVLSTAVSAQPTGVLFVKNNRVSIGTDTPTAPLDINIGTATPGTGNSVLRLERQGAVGFQLMNSFDSFYWQFSSAAGEFRISRSGTGQREMTLTGSGNMTITGEYFSTTCTTPCAPDYVFAPEYELMPLAELAAFVERERHLPNVPSAEDLVGPISVNQLQMTLLEKIEELTLYTIQQQETIDALQERLDAIER